MQPNAPEASADKAGRRGCQYRDPNPKDTFFIAFMDETTGKETYAAGRYLQPRFVAGGTLILDFNLAFNPYCAYNNGFACPLPPRDNRLPVAIRAGEKTYH